MTQYIIRKQTAAISECLDWEIIKTWGFMFWKRCSYGVNSFFIMVLYAQLFSYDNSSIIWLENLRDA